ncbi:MAG: hypothetical protein ACEQSE_12630, partial [Candidatus Aquirickettsiella gammari]
MNLHIKNGRVIDPASGLWNQNLFRSSLYLKIMKKNLYLLLLLCCVIPAGFAQLHSVSFEQIDSLQTIEKRK